MDEFKPKKTMAARYLSATVEQDLVPVIPLPEPVSIVVYLDFTYKPVDRHFRIRYVNDLGELKWFETEAADLQEAVKGIADIKEYKYHIDYDI